MCGIVGLIGDASRVNLDELSQPLAHRGPDDHGDFRARLGNGSSVCLANRRLAILDPSARGRQPMTTPDGRFVIVHNGEIYNHREIARELTASGVRFRGASDTEMILHAWQRWGVACLSRFRGMFAFAVWDTSEERLFLVRDRLGEKPLYYWRDAGALLFASEVRTLLATGLVPRDMSRDGLDSYLTFGSVADPFTLIEGVRALEAGHMAEIVDGRIRARPYWSLTGIEETEGGTSTEQAVDETASLLTEACRLNMESDVPVGVLLSGGIDSTACVATLSKLGIGDLRTFSVVFPDVDEDMSERRWSALVTERFGTEHEFLEVGLPEARSWAAEGVARMDEPSIDGINTYVVTRAVAAAGIKVAVSGLGGDELFLGYGHRARFPTMARMAALTFPRPVHALATKAAGLTAPAKTKWERLSQILPRSSDPFATAYVAERSVFSQSGMERLFGGPRPPQSRFVSSQGGATALGRLSRLELGYYLKNTLLRDSDQMSMANSVELRQPLLDARLVERVLALPLETKVRRGEQKPLLVAAVGEGMPQEVADRPKMGFVLPFDRWLGEGLMVADPAHQPTGLDDHAVRSICDNFRAGSYYVHYWALQVLAAWLAENRIRVT